MYKEKLDDDLHLSKNLTRNWSLIVLAIRLGFFLQLSKEWFCLWLLLQDIPLKVRLTHWIHIFVYKVQDEFQFRLRATQNVLSLLHHINFKESRDLSSPLYQPTVIQRQSLLLWHFGHFSCEEASKRLGCNVLLWYTLQAKHDAIPQDEESFLFHVWNNLQQQKSTR